MFNLVISNPPFEDSQNRKKTPHKLWIDFTHISIDLLTTDGELAQISPNSFLSPSSKILSYFTRYHVKNLNLDTGKFFEVGSTFADYNIIKNEKKSSTTVIETGGNKATFFFYQDVLYIPNDFNSLAMEIHKKVMFIPAKKLDVRFDYVTCHNVLLKEDISSLSKVKTAEHLYPVFHTNPQTWYSTKKQDFSDKKKVMWTRSGYTKPFYDNGTLGGTDMAYYVLVDSDEEGINLSHNLNSSLFKYVLSTARWSGFGNEIVFRNIPCLPKNQKLSDEEIFTMFSISSDEKDYVLSRITEKKKKSKEKSNNGGKIRDEERVKITAEVFTSDELAHRLVSQCDENHFLNKETKILEPSAGNGQLIMAIIKKMKSLGRSDWHHIFTKQLYIIEYMEDNIIEMIDRVNKFTGLDLNTLDHNIIWGNFLYVANKYPNISDWKMLQYNQNQKNRIDYSDLKDPLLEVAGDTEEHRRIVCHDIACADALTFNYWEPTLFGDTISTPAKAKKSVKKKVTTSNTTLTDALA